MQDPQLTEGLCLPQAARLGRRTFPQEQVCSRKLAGAAAISTYSRTQRKGTGALCSVTGAPSWPENLHQSLNI